MNASVLILRGALAFILGLLLAVWPGATLTVLLVFFPIFVILDGVGTIMIGSRTAKEGRWLPFIPMGILEIIIGIFVLVWPSITVVTFALLMALWAFVLGLGEFFLALADDKLHTSTRWLYAVAGVITFILGIVVLSYPLATSLIVIWLMGLFFLVYGIILFCAGLWLSTQHKKLNKASA